MSRHTYTTEIEFGGDEPTACFEVTLGYTLQPGHAAWGGSRLEPALNPPESAGIEDLAVIAINGRPRPFGWSYYTDDEAEDIILNHIGDSLNDAMIEEATTDLADERDRALEERRV